MLCRRPHGIHNRMSRMEYETSGQDLPQRLLNLHDFEVPCAVCQVISGSETTIMVPEQLLVPLASRATSMATYSALTHHTCATVYMSRRVCRTNWQLWKRKWSADLLG